MKTREIVKLLTLSLLAAMSSFANVQGVLADQIDPAKADQFDRQIMIPVAPMASVNTANGQLLLNIPIVGWEATGDTGVDFSLYYNSRYPNPTNVDSSVVGRPAMKWRHSYNTWIACDPFSAVWDGPTFARWWDWTGPGATAPDIDYQFNRAPGNPDDIVEFSPPTTTPIARDVYHVRTSNLLKYTFNNSGGTSVRHLKTIRDRRSNEVVVDYNLTYPNYVEKVTDASGRILDLIWQDVVQGNGSTTKRLSRVKDPENREWICSYNTDKLFQLAKITFPDPQQTDVRQFYIEFVYDTLGNITSITTPNHNETGSGELTWTLTWSSVGGEKRVTQVNGPTSSSGQTSVIYLDYSNPATPSRIGTSLNPKKYLDICTVRTSLSTGPSDNRHRTVYIYERSGEYRGKDYLGPSIAYIIGSKIDNDPCTATDGSCYSNYDSDLENLYNGTGKPDAWKNCFYSHFDWNNAATQTVDYTHDGTLKQYTDSLGNVWAYSWKNPASALTFWTKSRGNLWQVTNPDSGQSKIAYDESTSYLGIPTFNKLSEEDPLGRRVSYEYNTNHDLWKSRVDSSGIDLATTYSYYTNGNLDTITDPYGFHTKHEYESTYDTYPKKVTNLETGLFTEYGSYDKLGNAGTVNTARVSAGAILTTTFSYDSKTRQLYKTQHPDGSYSTAKFNAYGLPYEQTDENGNTVFSEYDNHGNVIKQTQSAEVNGANANVEVSSKYDSLGNITELVWQQRSNTRTTDYIYNERNQLVLEDRPGNYPSWLKYDYNGNGQVKWIGEGNGISSQSPERQYRYTFDNLGRPVEDLDTSGARILKRTYFENGLLKSLETSQPTEKVSYTYDNANRLATETQFATNVTVSHIHNKSPHTQHVNIKRGSAFLGSYLYEFSGPGGALEYVTSPSGSGTAQATRLSGPTTKYTYGFATSSNPFGLLHRIDLDIRNACSASTTFGYDSTIRKRLWLQNLVNNRCDGSILSSFTSANDPVGNRTSLTERTTSTNNDVTTYTYDKSYQLTKEERKTGAGTLIYNNTYRYDEVGNRTRKTLSNSVNPSLTFNATYGGNNEILSSGPFSFTHYFNGNLESKYGEGTTTRYKYDSRDNLTSLGTNLAGDNIAQYQYDAANRRVAKTVNGVTTRFIYDGDRLLAETDSAGAVVAWYTNGVCETRKSGNNWQTLYYHMDMQGSARQLTDSAQRVRDAYAFNAWGEPLGQMLASGDPAKPVNPLRYVGKAGYYSDDETGLQRLGVRYYDPLIGRFITPDPAQDGLNWYRYADNNPVTLIDPSGLSAQKPGDEEFDLINRRQQGGKKVVKTGAKLVSLALENLYIQPAYDMMSAGFSRVVGKAWQSTKTYVLFKSKVYDKLGREIYIGSKLAVNLAKAERGAIKGLHSAHHVVALNDPRAHKAREQMKRFEIDLNSAENGQALLTGYHKAMHTNAYYRWVNERASSWQTQEQALEGLKSMREALVKGAREWAWKQGK